MASSYITVSLDGKVLRVPLDVWLSVDSEEDLREFRASDYYTDEIQDDVNIPPDIQKDLDKEFQ